MSAIGLFNHSSQGFSLSASACLSVCLSVCLFHHSSQGVSLSVSVCLSVCLCVSFTTHRKALCSNFDSGSVGIATFPLSPFP